MSRKKQRIVKGEGGVSPPFSKHFAHPVSKLSVGEFEIFAGGRLAMRQYDTDGFDLLVPLTHKLPFNIGSRYSILWAELPDFGGVPENWLEVVNEVIAELKAGKKVMAFCEGGHGRTGTLLASLVAILEPEIEDPILAVRERYCVNAVETYAQAEGVFALKGMTLPDYWEGLLIG
jgi:protein-tyrosine phosphatase